VSEIANALEPFRVELQNIKSGKVSLDEPLRQGVGAEHGVVGLLDAVLEKAGTNLEFDPSKGGIAAKLSRQARRDGHDALADVLTVFRRVARMYPDVLGSGYGGRAEDFEEFRRVVVPRLLWSAEAWSALHDQDAVGSLREVRMEWDEIVGSAT
jgi:hypothetical protein